MLFEASRHRSPSERRADLAGSSLRSSAAIGKLASKAGWAHRLGRPGAGPSSGSRRTSGRSPPGELEEQVFERPVHLDPVAEFGEGPVGQHAAAVDDPDRIGQLLGDREEVGRHQDGHARPGLGEEQVLDDPGTPGVEADQGLVDDQDLRDCGPGPRRRRPAASSRASNSRKARRRNPPSRTSRSAR